MRLSWAHRALGVAGVALALAALGATPAAAGSASRAPAALTPIVECSAARGGSTRTLYGYQNTGGPMVLDVGPNNSFSPGPANRGQPTSFDAGTRINVFSVDVKAPVTWTLGNGRVSAPGPSCKTTPAGSSLAGWGPIAAVVIVTAVLGVLLFWRTRRLRTVAP